MNAVPGTLAGATALADILTNIQTICQENTVRVLAGAAMIIDGLYATNQISGYNAIVLTAVASSLIGLISNRAIAHTVQSALTHPTLVNNTVPVPASTTTATTTTAATSPPATLKDATPTNKIQNNINKASTCDAGKVLKLMAKTCAVGIGGALYGAPLIPAAAITFACYLPSAACLGTGVGLGYAIDTLCGNGGGLRQYIDGLLGIPSSTAAQTPYAAIGFGALIGGIPLIASLIVAGGTLGLPRLILAGVSYAGAGLISKGLDDPECFQKLISALSIVNIDATLHEQMTAKKR